MAYKNGRSRQRAKRLRLRVAASLMDFLGIIGCIVIVIVCAVLMRSLVQWVRGDVQTTFSLLIATIHDAVFVGG